MKSINFFKILKEALFHFVNDLEKFFNSREWVFKSSVNLAGINWGLLNNWQIIWKWNQVPDYAEAMIEVRIWTNISQDEFENFVRKRFKNNWYVLEDFRINFYLDWLLQPDLVKKYEKFASVDEGNNFWYSDIAMIKKALPNSDCLLLWPWPKSKAHQEDEYVDIESLIDVREKIKKIVL